MEIELQASEEHREELEMIDAMLSNNRAHLLYDAIEGSGETEQLKTVYTLFDYLKKEYLDGMRLTYEEVHETFAQRAIPLLKELEEDKAVLEEIVDAFLSRMVLNLITQDKVAFKVQDDMIRCLEELYDHREKPVVIERSSGGATKESKKKKKEKEPVPLVKNDFAHYDQRNREIADRCVAQRNPATDEIDIHFSKAKKRGRHQKIRNELVINTVEAMAGELIEKRQTLVHAHNQSTKSNNTNNSGSDSSTPSSPSSAASLILLGQKANTIDYYPIFKETLEVFNRCIPKRNNHGFYIQRLIQFIRTLDSHVWPLHGLMALANNMNYCVRAETVKMSFDRSVRRFYCCFSGLELQDGELATCIRVVENDAERLKEWRDNPPSNRRPFETEEFTRSVAAFYLKKQLCCRSTLFYGEFSDRYKSRFPDVFLSSSNTTTTTDVTTNTNHKRKRETPSVVKNKPNKKLKCEDTGLFDSLRPFDTKSEPCMMRIMMRHLHQVLELHLTSEQGRAIHYGEREDELYRRNYVQERDQITALLSSVTKKSFKGNMKQLAFYAVISSPDLRSAESDEKRLALSDLCIEAMLDFIEALVVPERKFPLFAASQKSRMMRAFVAAVEERCKKRGSTVANPFLLSSEERTECVKQMINIHWLMCCPLLFIILYGHLAREDATGYLRQANADTYSCKPLLKAFKLTLV